MGLDMYAERRFDTKRWDHVKHKDRYAVRIHRGGRPVPGVQPERISRVIEDVMYWRKANHIHKWFVDHVQNGYDDCKQYHVDWEILGWLLDSCEQVIKASELCDGKVNTGTVVDSEHPDGITLWKPGKVIRDTTVAKQHLPTCEGFFFGTYEYDEYYLDEVIRTRDWAKKMLKDRENGCAGDIYYESSW